MTDTLIRLGPAFDWAAALALTGFAAYGVRTTVRDARETFGRSVRLAAAIRWRVGAMAAIWLVGQGAIWL